MFKKFLLASAILVFFGSCIQVSVSTSNPPQTTVKTIVIPLYSYPLTYPEQYQKLYQIQTLKQMIVIINPSNGAGYRYDPNFADAVYKLKQKGYKVFGYVYSSYSSRPLDSIKQEIDRYNQLYPDLDGFFIDEVSNSQSSYTYYQQISSYIKSYKKMVMLNPGTTVSQEFYTIADFIVVFERDYNFLKTRYIFPQKLTDKDCFLVYGVNTYQTAQEARNYLLNKGANCIYLIDENPPSWFKVSPYLDLILQ